MDKSDCVQYDKNNLPYIDLGTVILRIEREEAPKWALEKAKHELRELPEIVVPAIEELKRLIQADKSINIPLDDELMIMFLRPCKFYPDSALKRLKNFFLMKIKYGESCENILPDKLQHIYVAEVLSFLPERDQHGHRIVLIEAGKKWHPSTAPLIDLFRALQFTVLLGMWEPTTQICGAIVILDMEGLPLSHLTQFSPSFAAMLLHYVQDCICIRFHAVHIINNSYLFNMLFAIFKPFIREKLRNRIFFHGKDFESSLAVHVDKNSLPAKYGGTAAWHLPNGRVLGELMKFYTPVAEEYESFGFKKGYIAPKK